MLYVIVNEETKQAKIYQDATQAAQFLGLSVRTIWYHKDKNCKTWGDYTLYYVPGGKIKSNRGQK